MLGLVFGALALGLLAFGVVIHGTDTSTCPEEPTAPDGYWGQYTSKTVKAWLQTKVQQQSWQQFEIIAVTRHWKCNCPRWNRDDHTAVTYPPAADPIRTEECEDGRDLHFAKEVTVIVYIDGDSQTKGVKITETTGTIQLNMEPVELNAPQMYEIHHGDDVAIQWPVYVANGVTQEHIEKSLRHRFPDMTCYYKAEEEPETIQRTANRRRLFWWMIDTKQKDDEPV